MTALASYPMLAIRIPQDLAAALNAETEADPGRSTDVIRDVLRCGLLAREYMRSSPEQRKARTEELERALEPTAIDAWAATKTVMEIDGMREYLYQIAQQRRQDRRMRRGGVRVAGGGRS